MSLPSSRANLMLLALTSVSVLALSPALQAQEVKVFEEETLLGAIHLVSGGKDNVEATGGTEVSAEDLDRLKPDDVSDLFSRESSVSVSGGGGAAKRVSVLGIEQSLLATSVDGVPQGATAWHHTGSNVVDPAFLKAVKVEAGAAAADAGFGAGAGSLRYETAGAHDLLEDGKNVGGRVGVSYGTNGRGTALNFAHYGRYKGFDWMVMVNGSEGKDYKDGDGVVSPGTAAAGRNTLAKFGFENEGHRFELGFQSSRDNADRLQRPNLGNPGSKTLHPLKVSNDTVKLSYTKTETTEFWDPEVSFYFSDFEYWRDDYSTDFAGDATFSEQQFGGKAQNTIDLGYGSVTLGLDFNSHDYSVDNYAAPSNTRYTRYRDFSTQQIGLFAQGRFEFENGLSLSTGARLDRHRFDDWNAKRFSDTGASLNATLAYRLNDTVEIFAGASDTWLGYVVGDYGYLHARVKDFQSAPDLKPGSAKNFKLGANFGGDNWQAGVTLFDTRVNNLFEYGQEKSATFLTNKAAEFKTKGFTMNAAYDFGDTKVGMSFTKADVTADGINLAPSNGEFFTPVGDQATLFVDHKLVDWDMTIGASASWAGGLPETRKGATVYNAMEDYTFVDAYAEWKPSAYKGLGIRLGIDNVFDQRYTERSGFGSTSRLNPVYAPGRTMTLKASLQF